MTFAGHSLFFVAMVFFGVSGNIFNLAFTIQQQIKTRTVQTAGLILNVISISNIVLVIGALTLVVSVVLQPDIWCVRPYPILIQILMYLLLNFGCISFWAIAWLSLFYCVKIVSFSSECFRTLKKKISRIINAGVLLICFISSLLFLPFFTLEIRDSPNQSYNTSTNYNLNDTSNMTSSNLCLIPSFTPEIDPMLYMVAAIFFFCPIPLMIMLPTSLRMVIHLLAHTLALRKNQTQVKGSDSYLLVCRLTISLVAVYLTTLIFVALFFILRIIGVFITYLVLIFAFSFYCGMTSVILTASNRYLKDKLWSLFCCREVQEQASKSQTCETADV